MIKKQYIGYFSIVFSIVFPFIFEKAFLESINFDTYIWGVIPMMFISLHFFIEPKKIWDFVYKKRWLICIGILLFVLFMEYNTSSIGMFDDYIEPSYKESSYQPIFGTPKSIRSDEWASTTPLKLSQFKLEQPFAKENDIIMAKNNNVTFYPQYPTLSFSTITSPRLWGYLLFGEAKGLTVDTMFEWIILIFVSFDFLMIITKQKKIISLIGSIIIGFSPTVIWWTGYNMVLYGQAIVVLVNSFINSKSKFSKLLKSILIGWLISCDIMMMYPAWLIPFTYIYFVIVLYLLITKTKKEEIFSTVLYVMLALIVGVGLVLPGYFQSTDVFEIVNNTVYPGKRFSVGGTGWETLFNYVNSLFLWYKPTANCSETSQFIGLFPLPIILGICYFIKRIYNVLKEKKKNVRKSKLKEIDWLLVGLLTLAILFSIEAFFPLPFLSKITMLSYSPTQRLTVTINYLCIIILFRYISFTEKKEINIKQFLFPILCGLITCSIVLLIFNSYNAEYLTSKVIITIILLFGTIFIGAILNYYKTNYAYLMLLGVVSLISGVMVNPISKGVEVLYNKPLAKEIQKIVSEDPDATWVSLNNSFVIGNYMAANGAKTINTTNMVPNLELWKKFDDFEKYNDIYNRYAYFMIYQTEEKSYFYLNQSDLMTLFINFEDLDVLGVNYIVSPSLIDNYNNKEVLLKLIYSKDNQNIYKVIYK